MGIAILPKWQYTWIIKSKHCLGKDRKMIFALAIIAIMVSFFISVDSFLRGVLRFGLLGGGVYFLIMSIVQQIQAIAPAVRTF